MLDQRQVEHFIGGLLRGARRWPSRYGYRPGLPVTVMSSYADVAASFSFHVS
jgi:hypothetical protein